MVQVGKTYKSGVGHVVTVNAICGDEVYYSDTYGCHFHKPNRFFAALYIGTAEYYRLKGEPEKAVMLVG
jgi:hypothetical protein